jgi:excisionase family DNA binding protein
MKQKYLLHTERQEAQRLNVSHRHMVNMRQRGWIPYIKLGRIIRYRPEAVDAALAKMTIREIA